MLALAPVLLGPAFSTGCAAEDDEDGDTEDIVWGLGQRHQAQTEAGGWNADPGSVAIGDTVSVDYDSAPPFDGGANCSGSATDGARVLRDVLLAAFPQIDGIGIYNCRVIANTNSMSLHGVGRALDVMLSPIGGDADNGSGDPIAAWLMQNAGELGVQGIIWDHSIWTTSRRPGERLRALSPNVNQHVDHIHAEINEQAGALGYDWYDNPVGPGIAEECPALPAVGGVVDDGPCLQLFGPAQFWRTETGGEGGQLHWTNAYEGTSPSNHARTVARLPAEGSFDVDVSLDAAFARFSRTRYRVTDTDGEHVLVIDQGAAAAVGRWARLGTFRVGDGGGDIVVVVEDNDDTAPPADARSIVVDAVRVAPTPAADPPATGTPPDDQTPPDNPATEPPATTDPPAEAGADVDEPLPVDDDAIAHDDEGGRADVDGDGRLVVTAGEAVQSCASTSTPPAWAAVLLLLLRRRRR